MKNTTTTTTKILCRKRWLAKEEEAAAKGNQQIKQRVTILVTIFNSNILIEIEFRRAGRAINSDNRNREYICMVFKNSNWILGWAINERPHYALLINVSIKLRVVVVVVSAASL